jgi:hypothetical protein
MADDGIRSRALEIQGGHARTAGTSSPAADGAPLPLTRAAKSRQLISSQILRRVIVLVEA